MINLDLLKLLGDGSQLGLSLSYEVEPTPKGIAQAFILGEEFIGDDNVALILGDNIFYGYGLPLLISNAMKRKSGATIFGYFVHDPERFGVVEFNEFRKSLINRGKTFTSENKLRSSRAIFLR